MAQLGRLGQHIDRRHLAILAVPTVQRSGLKTPDFEVLAEEFLAVRAGFAFAAGDTAMYYDLIAHFDAADARSDFGDHAGNVGTGDVRHDDLHPGQPAAGPYIVVVAGRGFDLDKDLVVADGGVRRLPILEDLGAAVGFEYHRLHFGVLREIFKIFRLKPNIGSVLA